ncbi:hypothetical protein L370_04056 [Enterobacter sp. MGH 24]|nr:hypothetical protein L370_04056 [Enterobacter sp. MGH 24]
MAFFICMLRAVNILHHISVNGPVSNFALCAGRWCFSLTGGDDFLNLFVLHCMLAVYLFETFDQFITAVLLAFSQPAVATSVRYVGSSVGIQELL